MPDSVAKHIRDMQKANSDFDMQVWSPTRARELLLTQYPNFVSLYDGFPYAIQRSDFSRYAILHAYGGMYMDLDYRLNVPLKEILAHLDADSTLGHCSAFVNETPNKVFTRGLSNSFMISRAPNHPFWMSIMSVAYNGTGITEYQRVMSGTGPSLITSTYDVYNRTHTTGNDAVGILPKWQFNPCSVCERGTACRTRVGVLACHTSAGAWNGDDAKAVNILYCNAAWISVVFILGVICITFITLYAVNLTRQRGG